MGEGREKRRLWKVDAKHSETLPGFLFIYLLRQNFALEPQLAWNKMALNLRQSSYLLVPCLLSAVITGNQNWIKAEGNFPNNLEQCSKQKRHSLHTFLGTTVRFKTNKQTKAEDQGTLKKKISNIDFKSNRKLKELVPIHWKNWYCENIKLDRWLCP